VTAAEKAGLFLCGWALLVVGWSAGPAAAEPDGVRELLRAVNAVRAEVGPRSVLRWSPELACAAQRHAERMAREGFFEHVVDDTPQQRAAACGYGSAPVLENLAWGPSGPVQVVEAWMGSPDHRRVLISEHTEAGVGHAVGAGGRHYWVMEVGR
jgi:uncharacterized protein YkwD